MNLQEAVNGIQPLDEKAMEQAREHWDSIAHPLHSLGKLEDMVVQIAGITGDPRVHTEKRVLVPMCADNGVVEEGVTQTGQEITALVAESFLQTKAASSIMCKTVNCDIFPVDVGVATEVSILNRKIAYGTKNMAKEPAMTREQAIQAVETGIEVACMMKEKGYQIMATGEMGIGNTTTSSAIVSVFLNRQAEEVTGRGAGLSTEGLNRKIHAIKRAIALNHPDPKDGIDTLAKVGGLDLAGLAGVFLGGAIYRVPVVLDGFISASAALAASVIHPLAKEYMLPSHVSKEPAAKMVLEALGLEAGLHMDMCLGEGTGAVTLFPILDLAAGIYHTMSTFQDINVEEYKPLA